MECKDVLTFIFLFPLSNAKIDPAILAIFINGYKLDCKKS